jgi:hypothetical protein
MTVIGACAHLLAPELAGNDRPPGLQVGLWWKFVRKDPFRENWEIEKTFVLAELTLGICRYFVCLENITDLRFALRFLFGET